MIEKVMEGLRKSSLAVSATAIILMAIMEIAEIVARGVFNYSFMIVDEFAGYFLAAMVFMGLTNCYAQRGMVRVEVLYNMFKRVPRAKRVIDTAFAAIFLIYAGIMASFAVRHMLSSFENRSVSNSFLRVPLGIPQIFMAAGILCFFFYVLLDVYIIASGKGEGR